MDLDPSVCEPITFTLQQHMLYAFVVVGVLVFVAWLSLKLADVSPRLGALALCCLVWGLLVLVSYAEDTKNRKEAYCANLRAGECACASVTAEIAE